MDTFGDENNTIQKEFGRNFQRTRKFSLEFFSSTTFSADMGSRSVAGDIKCVAAARRLRAVLELGRRPKQAAYVVTARTIFVNFVSFKI